VVEPLAGHLAWAPPNCWEPPLDRWLDIWAPLNCWGPPLTQGQRDDYGQRLNCWLDTWPDDQSCTVAMSVDVNVGAGGMVKVKPDAAEVR
jgi:hypothetical protein